jgi:hypothetical protein
LAGSLEKAAIIQFHLAHLLEEYRRLAFMMLDANAADASSQLPTSAERGGIVIALEQETLA